MGLVVGLVVGALALGGVGNAVYAADPSFDENTTERRVDENTPAGVNIGDPISATDADEGTEEFGQTLTYKLGGDDAASFDIDASTGQLITKDSLNFEAKESYSVTVAVDDGESRDTVLTPQTVAIAVNDLNEPPLAPFKPTVVSGADDDSTTTVNESTTSIAVFWHPP